MKLFVFHRFEIYFVKVLTTLQKVGFFSPLFLQEPIAFCKHAHTHSRKLCSEQKYFFPTPVALS